MATTLRIINKDIDLEGEKILAYLKAQGNNDNWEVAAWQACSPQKGGTYTLTPINNEIGACVSYDNGRGETAEVEIPPQKMATLTRSGSELDLGEAVLDEGDLTARQSGVKNLTADKDIHPIWCLNGKKICRLKGKMFNGGICTFELMQKVFFTIGSSISTETFIVQNWSELKEFSIESNLYSADIEVSVDKVTNKPIFMMTNKVFK